MKPNQEQSMSRTRRFAAAVLACSLFVLAGCDSKKTPGGSGGASATGGGGAGAGAAPTTSAPSAMLDLLPAGTVAVVYVPSLKGAEDAAQRLVAEIEPKDAKDVNFTQPLAMLGLAPADLDMAKGGAIAVTLDPSSPMPNVTTIVPAKDEKALAGKIKAAQPDAAVETAGGYAAVPMGEYKKGGVPRNLAAPLPAGDVIARVDVATLWKSFGPKFLEGMDEALAEAPGGAAAKPFVDAFKSAVEAASVMDLAVRAKGATVELDATVTFTDRSRAPFLDTFAKGDLAALARHVPNDRQMVMGFAFDAEKAWPALSGVLTASLEEYPPEARAGMKKMFDQAGQMVKHFGKAGVATGGIGPNGMEMTYLIESPDPAALIKASRSMIESVDVKESGMTFSKPEERTLEGAKLTTFKMKLDPAKMAAGAGSDAERASTEAAAKMLGKDGLTYSIAEAGKRVLIVIGGDDVVARAVKALKAGDASGALSKGLAEAGPDAFLYASVDMRSMMRSVWDFMPQRPDRPMPPPKAGDPILMTMIGNSSGNAVRFRLSMDVGGFAKMVKDQTPK
jgi:hypothetical protein